MVRTIDGMHYQQGIEGEIVFFTGVADGHMTPSEHDYESGGLKLLGRTSPILPCTETAVISWMRSVSELAESL